MEAHWAAKRRVRSRGAVPRRMPWLPMEPCSGNAGCCLGAADVAGPPAASSSSSAVPSMRLSSRPPRKPAPLPEAPAAPGPLWDLSTAASATWLHTCNATTQSGLSGFSIAYVLDRHNLSLGAQEMGQTYSSLAVMIRCRVSCSSCAVSDVQHCAGASNLLHTSVGT